MGVTAIGIALATQEHAPQPSAAAAGTIGGTTPSLFASASAPAHPSASGATTSEPASASASAPASTPAPSPTASGLPPSAPVRLSIPAVGVDSSLVKLGETADGTVGVPQSFHVAGWFTGSLTPGEVGPTVILGHVDSYQGPGIFFRLGALKPGDAVSLTRADGRTVTYRITGVREYPKNQFPTTAVYANTDVPSIRLITCGGTFDSRTGHYLSNIVAFGVQR